MAGIPPGTGKIFSLTGRNSAGRHADTRLARASRAETCCALARSCPANQTSLCRIQPPRQHSTCPSALLPTPQSSPILSLTCSLPRHRHTTVRSTYTPNRTDQRKATPELLARTFITHAIMDIRFGGKYHFVKNIGWGSFGDIYLAVDIDSVQSPDLYKQEFAILLNYSRSLRFEDKPDHAWLRELFRDLSVRKRFAYEYVFDWSIPTGKAQAEGAQLCEEETAAKGPIDRLAPPAPSPAASHNDDREDDLPSNAEPPEEPLPTNKDSSNR
ncbi:hypothetical protein PtA15_10A110 [Puccinia triticina]|uniref:Non-specific serine/threonine protein kinase n=1 Tax=Puccinia triticina TaxID=208348 RepID=A0ABY7CX48_9BASI|nr:uncharacterized protein PtA15_10A110 [Puccinia triticina]WAQ88691.1 hypothetical protein PtA15_10A110 [Puccinia triticina]